MRKLAILTVGFALAMWGPEGPSVAWGMDTVVYEDELTCGMGMGTDPAHDSIDIAKLSVDSDNAGGGEIVVTMELCDPPTDTAKYMVYLENDDRIFNMAGVLINDPTGVGKDGGPYIEDECDFEANRTFDVTGKVQVRIRKGMTQTKISGPAVGEVLESPDRVVFKLPYDDYNGESFHSTDNIYVWGRTQKKKAKSDKTSDFAPDGDYDDGCVQPEEPGETLEVELH